jgi:hypothetical protein
MKLRKWFENWDLTKLHIKAGVLEAEWEPQEKDREAAWELYVELVTSIATQPLLTEVGDEKAALQSVHALFGITREILRRKGRDCIEFTKIAVIVLNQVVRPFTAKWHSISTLPTFNDPDTKRQFREELRTIQYDLCNYTRLLADIAQVEDLTSLTSC